MLQGVCNWHSGLGFGNLTGLAKNHLFQQVLVVDEMASLPIPQLHQPLD